MPIEFSKALMDAQRFPATTIKAQPAFSFTKFFAMHRPLPVEYVTTFSRARYALYAAAVNLKSVHSANVVLLPAYHCPALVEPFIDAGYNIKFYPQNADLSSDTEVFQQLLSSDVTHVVLVRYFGFSQNTEQLIQLAFSAGKCIIEDNAHSMTHFWRSCALQRPEISASVTSLSKALGTIDGGALFLPGKILGCSQPRFIDELKALITGIRPAINNGLDRKYRYFKTALKNHDCLRLSRWLMMCSDYAGISEKRRHNYSYLASKLENSIAGKLLYPVLADTDEPYVLPFLLNDAKWFSKLRENQVQVLRWEELALPINQKNGRFREGLVQLPLHQELTTQQLDKIVVSLT